MLDSPGFIVKCVSVCVCFQFKSEGLLSTQAPACPLLPRHPSGYVLLTLANLSSFQLRPDAESRGALSEDLLTL